MYLILLIILILLLLGAVPAWPHSRNWGYAPSRNGHSLVGWYQGRIRATRLDTRPTWATWSATPDGAALLIPSVADLNIQQ